MASYADTHDWRRIQHVRSLAAAPVDLTVPDPKRCSSSRRAHQPRLRPRPLAQAAVRASSSPHRACAPARAAERPSATADGAQQQEQLGFPAAGGWPATGFSGGGFVVEMDRKGKRPAAEKGGGIILRFVLN